MKTKTKGLILTKKGKINVHFANALSSSRFNESQRKIYPCRYRGSGSFITLSDYTYYIKTILNGQGYKFTEGNDAPRGGQEGNFLKVSRTAYNFLVSLRNQEN